MVILSEFVEGPSYSSSINRHTYDVFLNFRGVDTRHNFTDHLYKALLDANITTFLDDENIETGEDLKPELESAIKESRASIIVLSKTYAYSSWCLDELVLILEHRMISNQIVIPIFYHVDPTHVRKQKSSFGDAMAKHKQKIEAETDANRRSKLAQKFDRWKTALREVSVLKGQDVNGRRETEFIEEIVTDIYRRLHISSRSPLQQLFGMEDSIKFVASWLKDASSHTADVLTILGMGGIGKTALAKYVYRLHSHEFDTRSFIEDICRRCNEKNNSSFIKDVSPRSENFNGLRYLQKQLYDDISGPSSVQVHDVSLYTSKIEKKVAHRKVFLVLDDIDSVDQLDALLGSKPFHPGSKIIITTKHAWVTESCALFKTNVKPRHAKHLLQGLSKNESLKLLWFHAFMSNDPTTGYEEVSEKLVKYCEGHPLALEVLGQSLHNRDVAFWEECLEELTTEYSSPINNVLRKSFDSLPSQNDKELFKHIACFFVGMDRDVTETILNACDINARSGIANLVDRCLLSIGWNNELMMHRLVQEMGRFIVRRRSPDKPWKRSRLWCHEESFEVLKQKKGTRKVLGLNLDMRMLENEKLCETFVLKTDALSKMNNMMLLQLNYVQMKGSHDNFPGELRWLCMHGFPLKSIPSDLPMENLVALDMSYSNIESFGICYSDLQQSHKRKKLTESCSKHQRLLGSLKILNLSFCDKLGSLGGFDQVPALERLIVTNCSSLLKVCESIEECGELVLIDLSYCNKLEKLPKAISMLQKLRTLLLDGCNLGESRVETRDMYSIGRNTRPSSSVFPKAIPSDLKFFTISLPRSLVRLSLKNNNLSTESFPMDFSCLYNLKELYLDGYNLGKSRIEISVMEAPEMFKGTNTKPSSSTILEALPSDWKASTVSFPRSLVRLSLANNNLSTESFPIDFSCLSSLEELYLDENPIVSLPNSVKTLPKLEILSMSNCEMLTSLEYPPHTLRELILHFDSKPLLRKVVFDPDMSPLKLSVDLKMFIPLSFEIEGVVKILPMADVEDEVLHSLGWTNILSRGPEESEIQMYYEFGIFSTIYEGKKMPNWFTDRSMGGSISFTIPSSPNNLRGLNFCSVQAFLSLKKFFELPVIAIKNITKNLTWLYKHCIGSVGVDDDHLIFLSHWMFGKNEMEGGDLVTATVITDFGYTKECGVSLVYEDDGEKKEEDVLGYYKSWNHIIGRDLSAFQTATGVYLLETALFALPGNEVKTYYSEYVRQKRSYLSDVHQSS